MAIENGYIGEKVSPRFSDKSADSIKIVAQTPVDEEESFRKRYSQELRSKKQQIYDKDRGYNELDDERRRVRQQMMRTPGRRGEIIKDEEINKEFARRFSEGQTTLKI